MGKTQLCHSWSTRRISTMMVLLPSEELLFGSTFRFQVVVATVLQGCTQHCPRGVRQRPSQREGFAQPDELCLGQQKMHENVWQRLAKYVYKSWGRWGRGKGHLQIKVRSKKKIVLLPLSLKMPEAPSQGRASRQLWTTPYRCAGGSEAKLAPQGVDILPLLAKLFWWILLRSMGKRSIYWNEDFCVTKINIKEDHLARPKGCCTLECFAQVISRQHANTGRRNQQAGVAGSMRMAGKNSKVYTIYLVYIYIYVGDMRFIKNHKSVTMKNQVLFPILQKNC